MLKTLAVVLLAFGCALSLSAQINGCANSTVVNNLGAAGPGNFTVFSMGGAGSLLNINLATITGSVGVANLCKIKESAPSAINGDIIVGSQVDTSGVHGSYGSITVDDATVTQAFSDATNAAAYLSGLPSTSGVQSQFPANGQVIQNLTVTGTAGINVVNLPSFRLDNGATLTLTGPAGTGFVINVWGRLQPAQWEHSGNGWRLAVGRGVQHRDTERNRNNNGAHNGGGRPAGSIQQHQQHGQHGVQRRGHRRLRQDHHPDVRQRGYEPLQLQRPSAVELRWQLNSTQAGFRLGGTP